MRWLCRVLVISFPHNPTGATVDLAFMQRVVDFCREHEMIVVHDFAYADVGFDGHQPPSILQAEGAKECAVELYSMTKSFSMAGWRSAFLLGNAEVVQALVKLKSYLDYGMFQPVQIAATVTINEAADYPDEADVPECDWGIVSIIATLEASEPPMPPITQMRNALGRAEGGSGVPVDRAKYEEAVAFWDAHAAIRKKPAA